MKKRKYMKLGGQRGEGDKRERRGKKWGLDLIQAHYMHIWILNKILKRTFI